MKTEEHDDITNQKEQGAHGLHLDEIEDLEPSHNDDALYRAARDSVRHLGHHTIDKIIRHLGCDPERLKRVVSEKMRALSDDTESDDIESDDTEKAPLSDEVSEEDHETHFALFVEMHKRKEGGSE